MAKAPADRERRQPIVADAGRAPKDHARTLRYLTSRQRRMDLVLWVSLAAIFSGVLVLGASVQTWRSTSRMAQLTERIDRIEEFETRIIDKLNLFNTGIQALIQELDGEVAALRREVEARGTTGPEAAERLDAAIRRLDLLAESLSAPLPVVEAPAVATPVRRSVTRPAPPSAEPPAGNARSLPPPSFRFRRIEGADGSVTYEKVR